MKVDQALSELSRLAKELDIKVTIENIGGELGAGGLCKVKGQWRLIMDKRTTPAERVTLLAQAMTRFPLEGLTMEEGVRSLIERSRPRSGPAGPAGHDQ